MKTFLDDGIHEPRIGFLTGMQHLQNAKVNVKSSVRIEGRMFRRTRVAVAAWRLTRDLERSLESAALTMVALPTPLGARSSPSDDNLGSLIIEPDEPPRTLVARSRTEIDSMIDSSVRV
jgi:hypothetical protein